jgi:hypothetical protein
MKMFRAGKGNEKSGKDVWRSGKPRVKEGRSAYLGQLASLALKNIRKILYILCCASLEVLELF